MKPPLLRVCGVLVACGAFLACGTLAACSTLLPKLQAPSLAITDVRFLGGSLQREQLQLSVQVTNPNDRAIVVRSIEANLDLADMPFAMGASDAPFTVPPHGQADFQLDVTANAGNALAVFAAGMSQRVVDYRLYGQVHLQRGLPRNLHFSHDGRIRL